MFDKLTENLGKIFDKLTGTGYLRESDIDAALREIRIALLEPDVALPVVKDLAKIIKEEAVGEKVLTSVSPGQMVVKIVQDAIEKILTIDNQELNLAVAPPAVILMSGLQGGGKTTSAGKLALKLKKDGKKVLLASVDIYRPAAQKQLEILAKQNDIDSLEIISGQKPIEITKRALSAGKYYDVVIIDTPPYLSSELPAVFSVSDLVIIPTKAGLVDLLAIRATIALLKKAKEERSKLVFSILFNMVKNNSTITAEIKELIDAYQTPVFNTRVSDKISFVRSIGINKGIYATDDHKSKEEIDELTNEIINLLK